MAQSLRQTIDPAEEKMKEQAKFENEKKSNAIETKVNIHRHLQAPSTNEKKRNFDQQTVNHLDLVKTEEIKANENMRIVELMQRLDINDF